MIFVIFLCSVNSGNQSVQNRTRFRIKYRMSIVMVYGLAIMRIRIGLGDRRRMGRLGMISLSCVIMTVLGAILVAVDDMTMMVIESASLEDKPHVDGNAMEIIEPVQLE